MTDPQWNELLAVTAGERVPRPPLGFIIDSPWLPNWFGISILDYFTSDTLWFEANRRAIETFPEITFLPGFWSEFGMCTEPSAFGCKCQFRENEFPYAEKLIQDLGQIDQLAVPDPRTDGLLPFTLNRLKLARPRIEALGHQIRFSVSRGPLNLATFLLGTTEFMLALKTDPGRTHQLLRLITDFLKRWHQLQRETFPSIGGIFVLDDIVGFLGAEDFQEFGLPYFKELFAAEAAIKFFHNDARCEKSLPRYSELGINLYNPGVFNTLAELRALSKDRLTLLGNIPPRDVLAQGTPAEVHAAVTRLLGEATDRSRLILSCAGGMPPGVSTENLRAFVAAAQSAERRDG
jgi:uroporphyrinogen-III decarboxylase